MSVALVVLAAALVAAEHPGRGAAAALPLSEGRLARLTVLVPKDGQDQQFEDGYKRHLEWHRAHGDRWTWLGWTVVTGERLGWFVDGTFDRSPAEIDAPVAPAEDAADNETNVQPHASFASSSLYVRRDGARSALKTLTAAFLSVTTCRVHPGRERDFQRALEARGGEQLVLELVSGGARPTWLVLRPAATLGHLLEADWLPQSDAIDSCTSEALRYRGDLSYVPREP